MTTKLIILVVSALIIAAIDGAEITCKANEVYLPQLKAPNCDTVCATLGEKCTVVYIQAPSGCYCIQGYARDANNVCIPIKKCPPKRSVRYS